tara:strand:+ start:155 stop:637 length:483 start_codon:yes stop_codon:yes gene_type:complete
LSSEFLDQRKQLIVIHRFKQSAVVTLCVGGVLVLLALLWPTHSDASGSYMASHRNEVPELVAPDSQLKTILAKVAGSRLIRPAQIQAAVKDTGAAQRLLSRLKLQSIVQMGSEPVAYVRVQGGSVQTVRRGGHLLDFVVDEIANGNVKLTLDGVSVDLTY